MTAFGAHSVASGLGFLQTNLLTLGILLAIYDGVSTIEEVVRETIVEEG